MLEVPADFSTIQSAINAACDGSEVVVAPGAYAEHLSFGGKSITLRSSHGPEVTTIDGQGTGPVILLMGDEIHAVVDGFAIAHGSGSGARIVGGSPTFVNCHFRENAAELGAGLICHDSTLAVSGCTFTGNIGIDGNGGVFATQSTVTVTDCVFNSNQGALLVGAIGVADCSATITNCVFAFNQGGLLGGAVFGDNSTLANCLFISNQAAFGSAIICANDSLIVNCTFFGNTGNNLIQTNDDTTVTNCILRKNGPVPFGGYSPTVTYSNVQGGYPGPGVSRHRSGDRFHGIARRSRRRRVRRHPRPAPAAVSGGSMPRGL